MGRTQSAHEPNEARSLVRRSHDRLQRFTRSHLRRLRSLHGRISRDHHWSLVEAAALTCLLHRASQGSPYHQRLQNHQIGTPRYMKKLEVRKRPLKTTDTMRDEYRFDYTKAKPNRFAGRMKNSTVAIILDPDVAAVFHSSEAANAFLRSVISTLPRRGPKRAKAS